jgi:hypothetical protein
MRASRSISSSTRFQTTTERTCSWTRTSRKRAGYTHVAFAVDSIEETVKKLGELDIAISGGPERLGLGISLFVRDPASQRPRAPAGAR